MHELSVVYEIIKAVDKVAVENQLSFVESIVLEVGEVSTIVPHYLQECFPAAIDGTLVSNQAFVTYLDYGSGAEGWAPLWVTDFPMFEWNEDEGKWDAMHHIFTSPKAEHLEFMEKEPGKVLGRLYDLVMNGSELGSGSIRISDPELQRRVMAVIGMPYEQAESKFGFLLKAYNYGAPVHGGIALGLDRLLAMMFDLDNLKDVIAFPQNSTGVSLVDECPNFIDRKQWEELHIMPDSIAKQNIEQ